MQESHMKARVSQLHKTETEWNKLTNFIPAAGEIVVFDPEPDKTHNYVRLKIGDGTTKLINLPFLVDSAIKAMFNTCIDAGRITKYIKK